MSERIIVPKGTKQNFETVFSDLQDYTDTNAKRRFNRFISSYGIEATVKNGTVTSTEFKVAQASPTTLSIEAGTGLTSTLNFLRTTSQTTVNLSTVASGLYTIFANAATYTDTPTAVVNGFLYDASGDTTATRQHAGVSFEVTASGTAATLSGVYLANIDWNGVDTTTVYDRRVENVLLFKDSAIDDSNIVKKDRDSDIVGNLTLTGTLDTVGDTTSLGDHVVKMADEADTFTFLNNGNSEYVKFTATKNHFLQHTGFGTSTPAYSVDAAFNVRAGVSVMTDIYTSDTEDDVLIQPKVTGGNVITKLFDDTGQGQFQDKDGAIVAYYDADGFNSNLSTADEIRSDKFTTDSNNDVLVQPRVIGGNVITKLFDDTGQGQFQDKDGVVVCYYDKDGFNFNKPATYNDLVTIANLTVTDGVVLPGFPTMSGVSNTEFIIGYGSLNGGAGLRALTEDPDPTNITNFKIYDNKPTSNPSEKASYVHLTWNYKDVNGIYISGVTFEATGLLEAGGNIDNDSANIVDKYLYFTESGNRYQILSWDNVTKYMTLGDSYAGEEPSVPNFPARIIDGSGTGYQVKITSNKDSSSAIDFRESDTKILNLDSTFITNPELSLKLALDEAHWIQVRCVNNLTNGSFIVLPSGVYDPDHTPGGQADQSYAQPYVNTLPTLTDDGSITLDATLFGFNIDVGGWIDESDLDKTAHEFEVGYTTLSTLDWASSNNTTKFKTTNRHIPVSTNTSATWNVGVRAYQNKQLVSLTKSAQVLAGGGGVPPNMSLMAEAVVDVTVISGLYANSTRIEIEPALLPAFQFNDITYYGSQTIGTNQLAAPGSPKKLIPDGETWNSGDGSGIIYSNNSTDATADNFIQSLGEGPATGLTNQLFYIGVSEASRKIYQSDLNSDMIVKKIVFDCDIANGVSAVNPGVIRIYQYGDEVNAGTMDITGVNAVFTQSLDVGILAATNASRRIIIDAWDPDTGSPNNTCQLSGTIRLYGENVVYQRDDASTTEG